MRIYLDASPVIYWVEKVAAFYAQVDLRIKQAVVMLVPSHLTLLECLVLPLRHADALLKQEYHDFIAMQVAALVLVNESVFGRAADIRPEHRFRSPAGLHLTASL